MNAGTGSNRPVYGAGPDDMRRVDAAGAVDAQNAPTSSVDNAQNAFPTAPTGIDVVRSVSRKCYPGRRTDLLPRSPAAQTVDGPWTVDCGPWTVDCGLWTVDRGL